MTEEPTRAHQAPPPDETSKEPKARHGMSTEVTWDQGRGHQPYTNQSQKENGEPADAEFAVGDRGGLSGNNLDQLEEVKRKP